ncbi:ABC transporter substrate-binding protein [Candidatus Margulisiibacteriota bacterium]
MKNGYMKAKYFSCLKCYTLQTLKKMVFKGLPPFESRVYFRQWNEHKSIFLLLFSILFIFILAYFFYAPKPEQKLTFWVGGAPTEINYWEKLIKDFEVSSGIKVDLVRQPSDTDQRLQSLIISLKGKQEDPDVFLMDVVWLKHFIKSKWLQSLDPYFERSNFNLSDFFPKIVKSVDQYQGRTFALPVFNDIALMYYRKDLLKKYGYKNAPQTWPAWEKCVSTILRKERKNNPNLNGYVWQGVQYEGLVCCLLEFVSSFGGGFTKDSQILLDQPQNARALQFIQNLIHTSGITPKNVYTEMKEEEARRSFQRGQAVFERNWLYAWKLHNQPGSLVKDKVGVCSIPHLKTSRSASTLGGWHVGISTYSNKKAAAWKLIQFILSYESQKKLVLNVGWFPARTDIYNDKEVIKAVPHLDLITDTFTKNIVTRPNAAYYQQMSQVIQLYGNKCLANKITPQEALLKMQREIDKIIGFYAK